MKWCMYIDYSSLNITGLKYSYPLPNIDKVFKSSSNFRLLSFMDAYFRYNEILLDPFNRSKPAFSTDKGNFCYKVIPFSLKSVEATYQRMMNEVFRNQIQDMLKVYMDDMILKFKEQEKHTTQLESIFREVRKHQIQLNSKKCTFRVRSRRFLRYYLTKKRIKVNQLKC